MPTLRERAVVVCTARARARRHHRAARVLQYRCREKPPVEGRGRDLSVAVTWADEGALSGLRLTDFDAATGVEASMGVPGGDEFEGLAPLDPVSHGRDDLLREGETGLVDLRCAELIDCERNVSMHSSDLDDGGPQCSLSHAANHSSSTPLAGRC